MVFILPTANDFQEWKCTSALEALFDCCAKSGEDSVVCSGIHGRKTSGQTPLKLSRGKVIVE